MNKPLSHKALLVSLHIGQFYSNITDAEITRETCEEHAATSNAGKFVKNLFPQGTLSKITGKIAALRQLHYRWTLPWKDGGTRILPTVNYLKYCEETKAVIREVNELIGEVADRLTEEINAAKVKLNGMFDIKDYPSPSDFRSRFYVTLDFQPLPERGDFRQETGIDVGELNEQLEQHTNDALKAAQKELWGRIHKPLAKLVERLKNSNARLKSAVIDNVREIADMIPAFNLTGDAQLDNARTEILDTINKIDAAQCRKNNKSRKQAAEAVEAITKKMSGYFA